MADHLNILCLKGQEIIPYIDHLAALRIELFRAYPYLYEGDQDYEQDYLQIYVQCPHSIMIIVLDQNKVVGASTAIPMEFEAKEMQQPFLDNNMDITKIFYFGESLLKPEYRGRNIYSKYFKLREAAARQYGSELTTFCAVYRSEDDPRKPPNYRPLDVIWRRYGYVQHPELRAHFAWREVDEESASIKPMIFWVKQL